MYYHMMAHVIRRAGRLNHVQFICLFFFMPYMLYIRSMSQSVQYASGFVCCCRKPLSCRSCFKASRVPLPAGSCRRLLTCWPPCGAASSWWAMFQSSVEVWRSFRCDQLFWTGAVDATDYTWCEHHHTSADTTKCKSGYLFISLELIIKKNRHMIAQPER